MIYDLLLGPRLPQEWGADPTRLDQRRVVTLEAWWLDRFHGYYSSVGPASVDWLVLSVPRTDLVDHVALLDAAHRSGDTGIQAGLPVDWAAIAERLRLFTYLKTYPSLSGGPIDCLGQLGRGRDVDNVVLVIRPSDAQRLRERLDVDAGDEAQMVRIRELLRLAECPDSSRGGRCDAPTQLILGASDRQWAMAALSGSTAMWRDRVGVPGDTKLIPWSGRIVGDRHGPARSLSAAASAVWSASPRPRLRADAVESRHVAESTLRDLSRDAETSVREAVARNPRVPQDVLRLLARDGQASVRSIAARNPMLPTDVLGELALDLARSVSSVARRRLAHHRRHVPLDGLAAAIRRDADDLAAGAPVGRNFQTRRLGPHALSWQELEERWSTVATVLVLGYFRDTEQLARELWVRERIHGVIQRAARELDVELTRRVAVIDREFMSVTRPLPPEQGHADREWWWERGPADPE